MHAPIASYWTEVLARGGDETGLAASRPILMTPYSALLARTLAPVVADCKGGSSRRYRYIIPIHLLHARVVRNRNAGITALERIPGYRALYTLSNMVRSIIYPPDHIIHPKSRPSLPVEPHYCCRCYALLLCRVDPNYSTPPAATSLPTHAPAHTAVTYSRRPVKNRSASHPAFFRLLVCVAVYFELQACVDSPSTSTIVFPRNIFSVKLLLVIFPIKKIEGQIQRAERHTQTSERKKKAVMR